MSAFNNAFGLNEHIGVRYTVTVNGSNFINAFQQFSIDYEYALSSAQDIGLNETAPEILGENDEVYDLLNPPVYDNPYDDEDTIVHMLTPHWSHIVTSLT